MAVRTPMLVTIMALLTLLPLPSSAGYPEPVEVQEELEGVDIAFLGRIDQSGASRYIGFYSPGSNKTGNMPAPLRIFEYVLAESLFEACSDDRIVLSLLVHPYEAWTFPPHSTLALERESNTWVAERCFVVRYATDDDALKPEIENTGGAFPTTITVNGAAHNYDVLGLSAFAGRFYSILNDAELVTMYVVLHPTSNEGTEWKARDRSPFHLRLVPKEGGES